MRKTQIFFILFYLFTIYIYIYFYLRNGVRSFHGSIEHACDVVDVIRHLQIPRLVLIGHSLGGGVAALVASMLGPSVVDKLIMIDTLGAWPALPRDTPRTLQEAASFVSASSLPHESIQLAAEYRAKKNFVGLMHVDDALLLARRGTVPAPQMGPRAVVWNYDPFLKRASPVRMTPDQALAIVDQLRVPTLVLLARDGLFKSLFTPVGLLLTSFGMIVLCYFVCFSLTRSLRLRFDTVGVVSQCRVGGDSRTGIEQFARCSINTGENRNGVSIGDTVARIAPPSRRARARRAGRRASRAHAMRTFHCISHRQVSRWQ